MKALFSKLVLAALALLGYSLGQVHAAITYTATGGLQDSNPAETAGGLANGFGQMVSFVTDYWFYFLAFAFGMMAFNKVATKFGFK